MADNLQPNNNLKTTPIKSLKKDADFSALTFGRVMPQAISLEEAVVGAIMIDKDALPVVIGILTADSFYVPAHRAIFQTMMDLYEKSFPIDLLTVREELKKKKKLESIGGSVYLAQLTNRVGSAANLEFHARIIAQKHIQRELIRVSTSTIKDSFEDTKDVFDILDSAERNLFDITQQNMNKGFQKVGALAIKARELLDELSQKEDGLTGVPSGFTDLDRITSGWQCSDLIIIAARPGMGKTAFTLNMAMNAAMDFNKAVAVFSLEMAGIQLTQRLISAESKIPGDRLRNGKIAENEWKPLQDAIERIQDAPIFIDDTPGINIFELRAKCRRLKMQHNIELVVIDYLQLMSAGSEKGNRQEEISSISRALKSMAKELNVPVIALSQLSRAVEQRGGSKRPVLSDLRESGAIEQDADIVTFIFRPDYYEMAGDDPADENTAEIIVAKHRNGSTGTVNLEFIKEFALFKNKDDMNFSSFTKSQGFVNPQDNMITLGSKMNADDEEIPF